MIDENKPVTPPCQIPLYWRNSTEAELPRVVNYYRQWAKGFITTDAKYHQEQVYVLVGYFQQWLAAGCWVLTDAYLTKLRKEASTILNMLQLQDLHKALIAAGIDPIE